MEPSLESSVKDNKDNIRENVRPVIDQQMKKILGVQIPELTQDITDILAKPILPGIKINHNLIFKKAKLQFKNDYIKIFLERELGNISEVAKLIEIDRRSIHRLVSKSKININKIRTETFSRDHYKIRDVNLALDNVIKEYKEVLHPKKLTHFYSKIPEISKDILRFLPEKPLPLGKAIEEFEKDYLRQKLMENNFDVKKTSERIKLRYETLLRKIKRYGLS